jgi:S1-C subfamily serine protease
VNKGSAAEKSGIKEGDVITAINGHEVAGVSEMQEWVARNRPGQSIQVTYRRKGETHLVDAVLKKMDGSQEMNKREVSYQLEGAEFEDVPYPKLTLLGLEGGVRLKKLSNGKWKKAGAEEEQIITHIDKLSIDNVADLNRILEMKKGGILVEGVNQHGEKKIFGMDW